MPGFSLTLLLLPKSSSPFTTSHLLSLLDEPADVPGWKWSSGVSPPTEPTATLPPTASQSVGGKVTSGLKFADPEAFAEGIKNACHALIKAEPDITQMDTIAGDGDCGLTLKVKCIAIAATIVSLWELESCSGWS
jgi:dihydroxyacetone kinase